MKINNDNKKTRSMKVNELGKTMTTIGRLEKARELYEFNKANNVNYPLKQYRKLFRLGNYEGLGKFFRREISAEDIVIRQRKKVSEYAAKQKINDASEQPNLPFDELFNSNEIIEQTIEPTKVETRGRKKAEHTQLEEGSGNIRTSMVLNEVMFGKIKEIARRERVTQVYLLGLAMQYVIDEYEKNNGEIVIGAEVELTIEDILGRQVDR